MFAENILVVDDDPIIGLTFQRELNEEGYAVDSVVNGEEALKSVKLKKYSLVFIDKVMPGMDGIEVCKKIKEISPDSILIYMTGFLDRNNVIKEAEFIDAGGRVYYLYKPFSQGELLSVVRKALKEPYKN